MDKRFEELLLEYAEETDQPKRKSIEETLWQEFGATKAIFVMDLSRFSTLTERYGIVYNLAMIRRMQLTTRPIIEANCGAVVKFEADNCFAMFDEVLPAVKAAIEINQAFCDLNARLREEFEINVSIGIDHGQVLLVGGPDYFGMCVNRASKLGEDVAHAGEILISEAAFRQLPVDSRIHAEPLELTVSGLSLNALMVRY